MGMRGTCSPGGTVRVVGQLWQIVPEPFGKIATDTMTPASHILWGSCWLGIASDAVSKAQTIFRGKGRAEPGVVPRSAQQLSELVGKHQLMRNELQSLAEEYDGYVRGRDADRLASVSFALRINNLKLSASRLVVEIVSDALRICGIAAYKNDTPFSLGRHLRDAYSAALMINNERIHETNASLLLVHKGT
jgi:acyl-CoA dehydrogenase